TAAGDFVDIDRVGASTDAKPTTTAGDAGKSEEEILWGGDTPLSEKEYDKYSDFPGDVSEYQDYKMEWGLRYKDRTGVSALTAGKSDAEIAEMAAVQTAAKKTLKDSFAATFVDIDQVGASDAAAQKQAVPTTTAAGTDAAERIYSLDIENPTAWMERQASRHELGDSLNEEEKEKYWDYILSLPHAGHDKPEELNKNDPYGLLAHYDAYAMVKGYEKGSVTGHSTDMKTGKLISVQRKEGSDIIDQALYDKTNKMR
ncbi:MAG: hypothetical protein QGH27_10180, partial [SAR324 cluster bacterium]|nr:hypothetical protein [SAR324 cluster bacterium]